MEPMDPAHQMQNVGLFKCMPNPSKEGNIPSTSRDVYAGTRRGSRSVLQQL